jgi:hypothetical protein
MTQVRGGHPGERDSSTMAHPMQVDGPCLFQAVRALGSELRREEMSAVRGTNEYHWSLRGVGVESPWTAG